MPREFTSKVVTANALLEGDVVYLTEADTWTRHLSEAEILTDEADADIRLLGAQGRASEVVGAYLADVAPGAAGPQPTHFREEFRRTGPSNYFHGKQAAR
ncbi:Protein of unknown function [Roseovarius nanhaiticus]|uniref:Sulfite reductase (NADPH) hemoprotein beta-component n=1 Tax=Roseovarius nanhaiticus TaxID=573024 RepID=A0A1N7GFN4_9RHOB|nr:DUF2849 domain-containing protein [Roseovarius nanhaiticus]SEK27654.1 Protein of unknown function [Roseovarius nanhaiticus]SIS11306.1 Protein of unknown function [Roseovarius nanhaiticus]